MRSRLSNHSALLGIGAAIALAGAPLRARSHTAASSLSRGDFVAVHASTAVTTSAADRVSTAVPRHRRSHSAAGAAVIGRRPLWALAPLTTSRVRPPAERLAASRLSARGYDATAPPLS